MRGREVEFKYAVDEKALRLSDFVDFCENMKPKNTLTISGWDRFFTKVSEPDSFFRHRKSLSDNELTFKRKTVQENNFIRTEHNLPIGLNVGDDAINDYVKELGYERDSQIFKNCFIFNYEYYTLVYYICFDSDMIELGKFVEIELKEDYDFGSEAAAWQSLVMLEKLCKKIGASPENRVNKSLYEMYKKGGSI